MHRGNRSSQSFMTTKPRNWCVGDVEPETLIQVSEVEPGTTGFSKPSSWFRRSQSFGQVQNTVGWDPFGNTLEVVEKNQVAFSSCYKRWVTQEPSSCKVVGLIRYYCISQSSPEKLNQLGDCEDCWIQNLKEGSKQQTGNSNTVEYKHILLWNQAEPMQQMK